MSGCTSDRPRLVRNRRFDDRSPCGAESRACHPAALGHRGTRRPDTPARVATGIGLVRWRARILNRSCPLRMLSMTSDVVQLHGGARNPFVRPKGIEERGLDFARSVRNNVKRPPPGPLARLEVAHRQGESLGTTPWAKAVI